MSYNWNWGILFEQSPEGIGTYLYTLWVGLQWTVIAAAGAWIVALGIGSVLGVLRSLPGRWFSPIAATYVEIFRNIPLLVQLFLWYFVMPELLPQSWGTWVKQLPNAPLYTAILGIGLYMGSRVGEQLRAGIQALPRGQMMAATAIGLTLPQAYRQIILPQAYRIILPPLTSEFLNTIKNTSVALTIGLLELTARARAMQEFSFQVFEAFTAATVIYLLLNITVTFAMRAIESWVAVPGLGVGSKVGGSAGKRGFFSTLFAKQKPKEANSIMQDGGLFSSDSGFPSHIMRGCFFGILGGLALGYITRPSLLGVKIPIAIFFSDNASDKVFAWILAEHMATYVAIFAVVGGLVAWAYVKHFSRDNRAASVS